MSDDEKPTVSIGFFNLPVATANFATDQKGGNELVAGYIKFCSSVLNEACRKLYVAAGHYFNEHDVVVNYLTQEEMMNYIKQIQIDLTVGPIVTAVLTPEGKVIEDEHAVEAIVSGKSINN